MIIIIVIMIIVGHFTFFRLAARANTSSNGVIQQTVLTLTPTKHGSSYMKKQNNKQGSPTMPL